MTIINRKNQSHLTNVDDKSARHLDDQCDEIPISICGEVYDNSDKDFSSVAVVEEDLVNIDDAQHPYSEKEINNVVYDLGFHKFLYRASKLNDSVHVIFYRNVYQEFHQYCFL